MKLNERNGLVSHKTYDALFFVVRLWERIKTGEKKKRKKNETNVVKREREK
jgi:hypothetical protein